MGLNATNSISLLFFSLNIILMPRFSDYRTKHLLSLCLINSPYFCHHLNISKTKCGTATLCEWPASHSIKHWLGQALLVFVAGVNGQGKQRESPSARQAATFIGFAIIKGLDLGPQGETLPAGLSRVRLPSALPEWEWLATWGRFLGHSSPSAVKIRQSFLGLFREVHSLLLLPSPKTNFETLPWASSLFT